MNTGQTIIMILGWVLALVAGILAFEQHRNTQLLEEKLNQAYADLDELSEQVADLETEIARLNAKIDPPSQGVGALFEGVMKSFNDSMPDTDAFMRSIGEAMGQTSKATEDMMKDLAEFGQDLGVAGQEFGAVMGELLDKVLDMGLAGMATAFDFETRYGPLLESLDLAPATRTQLIDLLTERDARLFDAAFNPSLDTADTADIDARIAEILTPEQKAEYDAYMEALPKREARESFRALMNLFAPGMTDDTKEKVTDAYLKESLVLPGAPGASAPDRNLVGAIDDILVELQHELAPDQYAAAEKFLDIVRDMLQFREKLVGSMKDFAKRQAHPQ